MTRSEVVKQAIDQCLAELYSLAQPSVTWSSFSEQCLVYGRLYKEWEEYNNAYLERDINPDRWKYYKETYQLLEWEGKSREECIGPKPYEFYYIPKDVMEEVIDSYVYAYKLDEHQQLLDVISILKNYCQVPIVDKYIEKDGDNPGYRGYEHPDNLERELYQTLKEYFDDSEIDPNAVAKELQNKFFEFLDMAGKFYKWNGEVSAFTASLYLGICPTTVKSIVIDNWKKYRHKDIVIDDSMYNDEED